MIHLYKNYSRFNNVLKFFILCVVSLLFISCDNFLNSQDIKQQIEDTIAYNNAMSSTLIFRTANDEGDFLTGNEKSCRLGYTVDIQFSLNTNAYVFSHLEAVSTIDKTVSRADYVEFTDIGTDLEKNNGVYKIRIKLLKQADDILIRPVCLLIPRVKQITPAYLRDGCQQDTSIIIEFNKPIDPQTFDTNCISIKNGEEELFSSNPAHSYFETPKLSNNNTIITIQTIKGKYLIPLSPAGQNPKDIIVSIISTQIKDVDGFALEAVEPHTYRINQNVDNEKPEIKAITTANTSDTTNWSYRTLTDKPIGAWSSNPEYKEDTTTIRFLNGDYSRNHIIDSLHINLQGYDKDSGIKCVKVHEVFEKTSGGIDAMKVKADYSFGTGQFVSVSGDDNTYEYSFDYKFASSANDGLYKLEIRVVDKAENESEPVSYYVIKDTDLKRRLYWYGYLDVTHSFKNPLNVSSTDYTITENCYPLYNETTGKYESKFIFHYFNFFEDNFYSTYKTLCNKLLIQQCNSNNEYVTIFEENNLSNQDEAERDSSNNVISKNNITQKINEVLADLVIDPDTTTKFKVVLYEENGTINEYPFAIAKRPRVVGHSINEYASITFQMGELDYSISSDISVSLSGARGILGKRADTESEISSFQRLSAEWGGAEMRDKFVQQKTTYYISFARVAMNDFGRIYSAYGKPYILYRKEGDIDWLTRDSAYFNERIYNPSKVTGFDFPVINLPELNDENIANGIIEFPPNSGKARVKVDITYPDDQYEYLIKVKYNGNIKGYFNSNAIELDNGLPYKLSLVACNSDGIIVAESDEKDCCYRGPDNYPPSSMDYGSINFSRDKMTLKASYIKDKDGERTKTSEGELWHTLQDKINRVRKIDFFFTTVNLGSNVTLEELKNSNYPMYSLNIPEHTYDDAPVLTIPLYFLEQGKYYVYYYMKDIAGNSALYTLDDNLGSYTVPILPEYNEKKSITTYDYPAWYGESEGCEKKDLFSITIPKYSDAIKPASDAYDGTYDYYAFLYSKFDSTSNKWEQSIGEEMSWEMLPGLLTQTDETFTYTVTSQNNESAISSMVNKFYKIEAQYGSGSGQLPVYLSPIYIFRGSDDYDYKCRNKNVMESYGGYQVFCDKPVLAHTMYSKFKFTETYTVEDAHTWEGRGVETGLVYNDGTTTTFSYTDENFEAIPAGCYYTTIFHFVDGTTIMTPVKQK